MAISSSERGPSIVAGKHVGLSTSCPPQHDGAGGKNFGSVEGRDHSHSFFHNLSSSRRYAVISIAPDQYFFIRSCHLASLRLIAILALCSSSI